MEMDVRQLRHSPAGSISVPFASAIFDVIDRCRFDYTRNVLQLINCSVLHSALITRTSSLL